MSYLIDVLKEMNRLRQLQYDAEWEGQEKEAKFYKKQADYYKSLYSKGELYEPSF